EYKLKLESKRSEVFKVENLLIEINNTFQLQMEKFINFQIAVSEAIINAIVHGNKENPEKFVFVFLTCNDESLCIKIQDQGDGFDIKKLPDPTDQSNILKEHGRGIFIIKTLVDEFSIDASESGTILTLKVNK
ncbi:MAG TPA: hypothetical protein DEP28_09080, partial [Bacteroidetes bacterium]|nr:hypothetical protein [Bacteroidota bacterium]